MRSDPRRGDRRGLTRTLTVVLTPFVALWLGLNWFWDAVIGVVEGIGPAIGAAIHVVESLVVIAGLLFQPFLLELAAEFDDAFTGMGEEVRAAGPAIAGLWVLTLRGVATLGELVLTPIRLVDRSLRPVERWIRRRLRSIGALVVRFARAVAAALGHAWQVALDALARTIAPIVTALVVVVTAIGRRIRAGLAWMVRQLARIVDAIALVAGHVMGVITAATRRVIDVIAVVARGLVEAVVTA